MSTQPSNWQKSIAGEWHGYPSVFQPDGTHVGWNKVSRSSTHEGDRTTYRMDTKLDVRGELRSRFEARDFEFGVLDGDQDRIYMGPDFMGSGQPFGGLVDARYYSPAWAADLRTMVHVLADGETQVYSSLLYDGPTLCSVFNGVYRVSHDYSESEATRRRIDGFVDSEKSSGNTPHVLPFKDAGEWTGEMQVFGADQKKLGEAQLVMDYTPVDLLRAEVGIKLSGAEQLEARFVRARNGNRHTFHGPDLFGNGFSYGRALYTSQHITGTSLRIEGREFIIDDKWTMSVVWKLHRHGVLDKVVFGTVNWKAGEKVLNAQYS